MSVKDSLGQAVSALDSARKADTGSAPENSGAAFLVKSFTLITAVLAILGVSGGVTGRMVRNEAALTAIAVGATGLAVLMGVISGLLKNNPGRQWRFLAAGLILFAIATGATIAACVGVWGDRPAPNVAVSVNSTSRGDLLRLAVKDSGLKSGDRLSLAVWPLTGQSSTEVVAGDQSSSAEYSYSAGPIPLYEDVLGPDAEGNVEASPHALLPLGHPPQVVVDASVGKSDPSDCNATESQAGCVILNLGNSGEPQLRASWKSGHPRPILKLAISAQELGPAPLHALVVGSSPKVTRRLAAGILAPGPAGAVSQTMDVPVPTKLGQVCAAISSVPIASCPPREVKQPPTELKACVKAQKASEEGHKHRPTEETRVHGCEAAYRRYVAESTTWQRVRTP
jgi:hypothetical protein